MKGQIIGGSFGNLILRQKSNENLEIGELLIAGDEEKVLLQVVDLSFGSQISQSNLELVSGMDLENSTNFEFLDQNLRLYNLATVKSLLTINNKVKPSKIMPNIFSKVREVRKDDLNFTKPVNSMFFGNLRSGSKELDVPIYLDGKEVLSHHILIPATTGRGKSNLASVLLWDLTSKDYNGILVLDPHDEYYNNLKDHERKDRIIYYTPSEAPPGQRILKINLRKIKPEHFNGVFDLTQPQMEAISLAHKLYGNSWIIKLLQATSFEHVHEATLSVIKRKISNILDISILNGEVTCKGIFDFNAGESTISDIVTSLENCSTVIINTSYSSGKLEILIGSLITSEVYKKYKYYKMNHQLKDKPIISVLLEEAPRVLGKEVLEKGSNIFSTIAREGRKFKVGLIAITQLPSLIPRQVLANMNTKIILGIEMAPERQAIIDSASQDISSDNKNIAALDKGEAIIPSNFSPFAVPIRIPFFQDFKKKQEIKENNSYSGINLG
ncbi:ATP-binding protein [Candidatus Woesearchaeota archaeon]|nr:ATP-binding protein [Candidatus Woesearchaeota archaeon]